MFFSFMDAISFCIKDFFDPLSSIISGLFSAGIFFSDPYNSCCSMYNTIPVKDPQVKAEGNMSHDGKAGKAKFTEQSLCCRQDARFLQEIVLCFLR